MNRNVATNILGSLIPSLVNFHLHIDRYEIQVLSCRYRAAQIIDAALQFHVIESAFGLGA
jgi:hypothetical protein